MTRAREIREERFPLFFFLPSRVFSSRVFYHTAGVPPTVNFFEFKLQPTLHVLSSQLSVSVTRIHVAQKTAGVSSFRALHIDN